LPFSTNLFAIAQIFAGPRASGLAILGGLLWWKLIPDIRPIDL